MATSDRSRWDDFYRRSSHLPYPPPDPLLFEYVPPVVPGQTRYALDLAGGLGQNALWLAAQGYVVDLMDVSRVALSRARAEMIMRNLRSVNLLQVDVDTGTLEPGHYDVICVYDYLKRHLFPQICAAVKPGGRVIYSSLNLGYLREVPDFNHDFLLEPGELERVFEDWKTILYNEGEFRTQTVVVKPRRQPAKP